MAKQGRFLAGNDTPHGRNDKYQPRFARKDAPQKPSPEKPVKPPKVEKPPKPPRQEQAPETPAKELKPQKAEKPVKEPKSPKKRVDAAAYEQQVAGQVIRENKAWERVKSVLTALLLLFTVGMVIFTVISVSTFDRNDRAIFGYRAMIVRSDSMKATDFAAGDLVLVRPVDPAALEPGDIIAFRSADPSTYGETFTHKIRARVSDAQGRTQFITYGTTTGVDDPYPVSMANVLGIYETHIPKVGTFFMFLKTVPGYLLCIFLPLLLLIALQGLQSLKLFRQYRKQEVAAIEQKRQEELETLQAQRQQLSQELEESRKMLRELQEMVRQLQQRNDQE